MRVATPVEQLWHRVPGGTARATVEMIDALASTGGVDEVVPFAAWHRRSERGRGVPIDEPIRFLPAPRPVLYEAWIRWRKPMIERWVGGVDVTWASSMVPVATAAPLVVTVHDLDFLDDPSNNSRRGRAFFPRAWAAARERASLIVCPSGYVADAVVRHGADTDRVRVVPWGVSAPPVLTDDEVDAIRVGLGLPGRFVLWVGTMEPRKNVGRLVEAMTMLDEPIPLALVGGDGWSVDAEQVLEPLGLRAIRLGSVSDEALSALYRASTVFAFPSLAEGFGLPVIEAMANGTPVVTSAGTATEEVAAGAAELVDPTDVSAIAAGVANALCRDVVTLQRIEQGLQRVGELTWSAAAEGYAAVFAEAVERR